MTEQELQDEVYKVLDHIAGDTPCTSEWLRSEADRIIWMVRAADKNVNIMQLPLPAGYQVEPRFTTHTRPMRIDT